MAAPPQAQLRCVVFTLNNPEAPLLYDSDRMSYLVYQKEIGEETGTPHFQGYCEFKRKLAFNTARRLLGGEVWVHSRNGTQEEAITYATKEDTRVDGPWEFGEPMKQGERTDLKGFAQAVKAGKRKRDLLDEHINIIARYPKFYDHLSQMYRPKRGDQPEDQLQVTLLIGETGLGKTRLVYDKHGEDEDFYIAPLNNGTQWWDGYDQHRIVLMDDFCGKMSHLPLASLLRLLDRYPVCVATKGGHTWWLPNHVYITTNILPKDWYDWSKRGAQYKALARRFTKVLLFFGPEEEGGFGVTGHTEQERSWWTENAPDMAPQAPGEPQASMGEERWDEEAANTLPWKEKEWEPPGPRYFHQPTIDGKKPPPPPPPKATGTKARYQDIDKQVAKRHSNEHQREWNQSRANHDNLREKEWRQAMGPRTPAEERAWQEKNRKPEK